MIKLKSLLNEGFTKKEQEQIVAVVKKCYNEKGNKGVRNNTILNNYLGKLDFEVDAADIEIDGWESNSYNRQIKNAKIFLQGKYIGSLRNL